MSAVYRKRPFLRSRSGRMVFLCVKTWLSAETAPVIGIKCRLN